MSQTETVRDLLTHEINTQGTGNLLPDEVRELQYSLGQVKNAKGQPIYDGPATGNFGKQTAEGVMNFLELKGQEGLAVEVSPFVYETLELHVEKTDLNTMVRTALSTALSTPTEYNRGNSDLQANIQRGLERLGYEPGRIDGNIQGRNSMTAIAEYVIDHPHILESINPELLNDSHKFETADRRDVVENLFVRAADRIPQADREAFLQNQDNRKAILDDGDPATTTVAQLYLKSLGHDPNGIDGIAGPGFMKALSDLDREMADRAIEQDRGLKTEFIAARDDTPSTTEPSRALEVEPEVDPIKPTLT